MSKPEIVILTAMHNRPRVSELFCLSIERIRKDNPWCNIEVHAACSDDPSKDVCKKYGVSYSVTSNDELGKKWNKGMEDALNIYPFDYALIMGDDDIMSSQLFSKYKQYIASKVPYFGVNQIYFYSPKGREAVRFQYDFKAPKLIGCGRMLSRELIEKIGWQMPVKSPRAFKYSSSSFFAGEHKYIPTYQAEYLSGLKHLDVVGGARFSLWENSLKKGLDMHSEMTILFNGYLPYVIQTDLPMITDVKTEQNIWQYSKYKTLGTAVDIEHATSFWSNAEKQFLKEMILV